MGTISATAALMAISIHWASSESSVWRLLLGAIGITVASSLLGLTVLPIECKIGPERRVSIPCRLQSRRLVVDAIALGMVLLVIVNIFAASV